MLEKIIAKSWFIIVAIAAISISTWSLYWLGRRLGMPIPIAAIVSACFDGGAVGASLTSLKWARIHGTSGISARFAMFLFAGSSAYLNVAHATLAGLPTAAKYLFAMPSIIALTSIELHLRFEYRRALRNAGRIAPAMPTFGHWAYLLFPLRTLGHVRAITRYRGDVIRFTYAPGTYAETPETIGVTPVMYRDTPLMLPPGPGETTAELHRKARVWARQRGFNVSHRGPVSADIVTRYLAARAEPASPAPEAPDTPETSEETTGFSLRAVRIPNQTSNTEPVNGFDPVNTRSEEIS